MEKLSIYELLAYLIPGFIFAKLLNGLGLLFNVHSVFDLTQGLNISVLLFIESFILGVLLHIVGDKLKPTQFYKDSVYTQPAVILEERIKDEKFPYECILKSASEFFKETSNWDVPKTGNYPLYLFDYAYWYLEVKGKMGNVKTFQSIYYLFRNITSLNLIFCIAYLLSGIYFLVQKSDGSILINGIYLLILAFICGYCASYFRKKYVLRTIELYTIHRIHKTIDK